MHVLYSTVLYESFAILLRRDRSLDSAFVFLLDPSYLIQRSSVDTFLTEVYS